METKRNEEPHERLSAVEVDVRHLEGRLTTLSTDMQKGFANVSQEFSAMRSLVAAQKQPVTAFAGWAAVILSLVFAFGSPLKAVDARLQKRIDFLEQRELEDSYSRGKSDQKFSTLSEKIDSAVKNRKDIDAKHVSAQIDLRRQIEVVEHSLDNGLGRRIDEKLAPSKTDIEWIKSKLSDF